MRLHRLELTAFGPFPDTEVVDFEPLNAAGLFLLTGPTGAGKTSILDGVCFALYGAVPGGRNGAKAFKSDHAPSDRVPSVTLELTVRDRRIRIHRQPGWSRPSRRAKSGAVEEKTKASISELVEGCWVAHSSRVDEVGHLVTSLLGMNKDQFCQVVLLPQGEFQTFLSAGAKERHDVLESLFRTHRFQAIERWLVDHRRQLDAACRVAEAQLDRQIARVDEVLTSVGGEAVLPTDDDSPTTARLATLADRLRERTASVTTAASAAAETATEAGEHAKTARHVWDEACTLVELQQRHRDAHNRRDELTSTSLEVRRRQHEIVLARQAAAFEPLLDLVTEAEVELLRTDAHVHAVSGQVRLDDKEAPSLDGVQASIERLHRELIQLDALAETQRDLARHRRRIEECAQALAQESAAETRLVTELALGPDLILAARAELAEARGAAARLPAATATTAAAQAVLDAARRSVELVARTEEVDAALLAAREARADARDRLHDVRDRRIAGMAAQLAEALDDGSPCPVCGSHDHPLPAVPGDGSVSADDEASSEEVVRRGDDEVGRLELRRERLRADRTAADHLAHGLLPDAAQAATTDAMASERTCADLAATASARERRVASLEQQLAAQRDDLAEVRSRRDTLAARLAEHTSEADRLRHRIDDAVRPDSTVAARHVAAAAQLESTTTLELALRAHAEAATSLRTATGRLDRLVAGSVFATVQQVRNAVRSEADIASGEALNRAHGIEKAATDKALADPTLLKAAESPTPDLVVLERSADQAAAAAALATATAGRWERASARLDVLAVEVDDAVSDWQPLRIRRDRAEHVSTMVSGIARDNTTKTKLSHYVLAARLAQVVAAANVRLAGICGGRYELEHTLLRGVGDARGGLGLRVLDTYTGAGRDPATLSGGETFYVSLALALGLADLVNNEIGAAELSTLFVDEGFGTLDADTLDEVMDELDALRSGGRAVGLVSHLAELRTRVPAQLSVVRSPDGSRLDDS